MTMVSSDGGNRYLHTLSTMEKTPVDDLIAKPLESDWLWLLNAGSMEARARSGVTRIENLPGTPVQVVELLGKPYALVQYASPTKAAAAIQMGSAMCMLSFASTSATNRILANLRPSNPEPIISATSPAIHTFSNGLMLVHEFITPGEEADLIHQYHLAANVREGRALKRGALHFGPHFDYTTFAPSTSAHTPPPEYLTRLLSRLPLQGERDIPDQFTIQYYPPGTGIPPHVDTHSAFEEALYSLSFGASVPMDFRQCGSREARRMRLPKRSLQGEAGESTPSQPAAPAEPTIPDDENAEVEEWKIDLPPRSLLVMTGASRFGYTHGIKGRRFDQDGTRVVAREDRYSITMRRVKPLEEVGCECPFPAVCDWRIRQERGEV